MMGKTKEFQRAEMTLSHPNPKSPDSSLCRPIDRGLELLKPQAAPGIAVRAFAAAAAAAAGVVVIVVVAGARPERGQTRAIVPLW